MEEAKKLNRNHKDKVFRLLFNDRKKLLELYNCLNNTDYQSAENLIVTTLDNAIFMNMKNDVSFIIDGNICLYEHQSSLCPNMPLRGLFYLSDLYKTLLEDIELSSSRKVKIPTPHYIVFYNGEKDVEDLVIQKLSDSFENGSGDGCIEIVVKMLNINFGHNKKLLEGCKSLYGYSYFVSKIRQYKKHMPTEKAALTAIDECIRDGVLADFLKAQKSEVVAMSIYEYDEEKAKKVYYEDGLEDGIAQGIQQGINQGLADSIIDVLNELGTVSKNLKDTIYAENDVKVLRKWFKLSVTSESIEEFINAVHIPNPET